METMVQITNDLVRVKLVILDLNPPHVFCFSPSILVPILGN